MGATYVNCPTLTLDRVNGAKVLADAKAAKTATLTLTARFQRDTGKAIIAHLPGPEVDPDATLQFQVNNLDYDDYVGRLAIGRIIAGSMTVGQNYSLCRPDGVRLPFSDARQPPAP